MKLVIGCIWKLEWDIYGSKNALYIELYIKVRMGYIKK